MTDKIAEIRARHQRIETTDDAILVNLEFAWANADRGWLLAEVERLRAGIERLTRDRRERIATAALQGILAGVENGIAPESWADFISQRAVIYADALIAELDKEAKP